MRSGGRRSANFSLKIWFLCDLAGDSQQVTGQARVKDIHGFLYGFLVAVRLQPYSNKHSRWTCVAHCFIAYPGGGALTQHQRWRS